VLDFCWSIVWLGFDQVHDGILYKLSFGPGLLDSGPVWFGFAWVLFGLVLLGLVWCILQLSFVPLVWICFPALECRVATLLILFTGSLLWETCFHCSLPSPGHWSLAGFVYPDSCEGKCL